MNCASRPPEHGGGAITSPESLKRMEDFISWLQHTNMLHADDEQMLVDRFVWGEWEYGNSYRTKNLHHEIREEVADIIIYTYLDALKQAEAGDGEFSIRGFMEGVMWYAKMTLKALRERG